MEEWMVDQVSKKRISFLLLIPRVPNDCPHQSHRLPRPNYFVFISSSFCDDVDHLHLNCSLRVAIHHLWDYFRVLKVQRSFFHFESVIDLGSQGLLQLKRRRTVDSWLFFASHHLLYSEIEVGHWGSNWKITNSPASLACPSLTLLWLWPIHHQKNSHYSRDLHLKKSVLLADHHHLNRTIPYEGL